jgi:hypothetical protein
MGTKKTTTNDSSQVQKTTFDPAALGAYHGALNSANSMVANPFSNKFYDQNVGLLTSNAQAQNQNQMQNLTSNLARSGVGTGSGAGNMIRSLGGYMASRNQANAFTAANQMGQQNYWNSMNFVRNPLVTGGTQTGHSTSVEQTGGLGTWLPQVAGMALGAATGGMAGGGLMGAMKGAMGMGGGGGNSMGGFMGSIGGAPNSALNMPSYMPGGGSPSYGAGATYGLNAPFSPIGLLS